ncbi:hypothetical protein L596_006052 [Steinernema carpocapsae]|uniref:Peptidase M13 C-terminal domain-containing protein n=1 Tax=Steinernema carpocapsae TaxID=34508 RepID=A0A4U8V0Y2_STECR|nr:hypothetical protein L596_006052 [Steinernema carpocapsae]
MIDQLDWMESSRADATLKIQDLKINIAYPDMVKNLSSGALDNYYKKLIFADKASYYDMLVTLDKFNQYIMLSQLTAPQVNRIDFLGAPATVNAWYQPELNSITVPAGILVEPYYNVDWPASMNFGAMGTITGHELTHGFDDQGIQYDHVGRAILSGSWMTADSKTHFDAMAKEIVDEYGSFCFKNDAGNVTACLNGPNTQGENIADNGGIHSAYRAYRLHSNLNGPDPRLDDLILREFNHDQLFFLSFAQVWCQAPPTFDKIYKQILTDVHSPSRERVFGTLQNFPAFRTAFSCPVQDGTYAPSKHAYVWVPDPNNV